MTHMVTRCPTCATAFRVTSTQLDSAKGAVRCGSCLHIFQAQDYLVKTEEEKSVVSKSVNPEPEIKKPESILAQQKTEPAPSQPKIVQPKQEQVIPKAPVSESVKPVQVTAEQPIAKKAIASTPVAASSVQQTSVSKVAVIKPIPPQTVAKATPVAKQVIIDKAKILADEDDVLISDDMDRANEKPAGYEFDGFIDLDMHPKQTVSLFEREIRYEPARDNKEGETTDESWAEGLLDDDGEPTHQFKKPVASIPEHNAEVHSAQDDHQARDNSSSKDSDTKYSGPIFSLVSESTTENSAENKDEPFFSEAFLNATRAPEPVAEPNHFAAALFEQDQDAESDESDKSSKRPVKSSSKMRAFDTSRAALLMNIMPAPVEFTARRMRRYQKRIWPVLAVVMLLLLVIQIAYFKFDYFSRVEPYRTVYLFTCPLLGCEVPALVDTSQILATNLIVRNHPDTPNALMVDAILINNAPFEQPFPDLILSFSKLDETPVASRRFTPKDYIGGELAGMKYIPQRQPVHITLEISDPGPEAVNYTLATH
jgi:predicted Zn finger-like uncharacterized protein